jgi:hypothetical protein
MAGTLTFPLSCFVGLAVAGAEVTAPGYVRQAAVMEYCEDGVTIANLASLQWQHATQPWGTIDTVQLWAALTAGELLGSLPPVAPVSIGQYDIARIPASGLAVTYDTVSRPYGTGGFGTFGYGTARVFNTAGVVLGRGFDQTSPVCIPGTWAPGPFSLAA